MKRHTPLAAALFPDSDFRRLARQRLRRLALMTEEYRAGFDRCAECRVPLEPLAALHALRFQGA